MNRIYHGKVTDVEIYAPHILSASNGERNKGEVSNQNPWQLLDNWPEKLWQHHALFQDAGNYYLVCLLALASDPESDIAKIRARMTKEGDEAFVWGRFRRRGVWRRGLWESVAPYLTPEIKEPSFEQN